MNDPQGILEEFAERAFRLVADPVGLRFDGVNRNAPAEDVRSHYRAKHEGIGLCRSCVNNAKPGRKYCLTHLAKANERARRSLRARLGTASP